MLLKKVSCLRTENTVERLQTATSQTAIFLADSPYIHSCFNLSTTATSLQWPLPSGRCRVVQLYTAISRKVVGKSARDNPERYCGWF